MSRIYAGSIDLSLINMKKVLAKARKNGQMGQFYPISIIINDKVNEHGESCAITEGRTKEEREFDKTTGGKPNYLGNAKLTWNNEGYTPIDDRPAPNGPTNTNTSGELDKNVFGSNAPTKETIIEQAKNAGINSAEVQPKIEEHPLNIQEDDLPF